MRSAAVGNLDTVVISGAAETVGHKWVSTPVDGYMHVLLSPFNGNSIRYEFLSLAAWVEAFHVGRGRTCFV